MESAVAADEFPTVTLGTSILAMKFKGGVILAADAMTSHGSVLRANQFTKKITRVADRIFMLRCGNAAHTQFVAGYIRHLLQQHQLERSSGGMDVMPVSVKSAASISRLIVYNNKKSLNLAFIVAGIDAQKGPQVYGVQSDGGIFERDVVMNGSGSTMGIALVDELYRRDMSKEEAVQVATKVINCAIMRDKASGCMIHWTIVTEKDGVEDFYKPGSQLTLLANLPSA